MRRAPMLQPEAEELKNIALSIEQGGISSVPVLTQYL